MIPFEQFVFFLDTAQERMANFVGEERQAHPDASYVGPELVPPGRYRVQDGVLRREEAAPRKKVSSIETLAAMMLRIETSLAKSEHEARVFQMRLLAAKRPETKGSE